MTTPTTASAQPERMTDSELIEALAVDVMGWTRRTCKNKHHGGYNWECFVENWSQKVEDEAGCPFWIRGERVEVLEKYNGGRDTWHPLTDWNHWRQVEKKIMSNYGMRYEFESALYWLSGKQERDPDGLTVEMYMRSDLRTRCIAALKSSRATSHD